ncbi:uncharacterized protein LOC144350846 [Saccoglossus kowalevskii]
MDKSTTISLVTLLMVVGAVSKICDIDECREEGDAFMFDPDNWDQPTPVFMCNFVKVRLECLQGNPCDSADGTTNYTSLVELLQSVVNYYTKFGLCDDTIDDSLPYDHEIKIRERCLEESMRRIKSPFAISCLETGRLTYCIYEEQLECGISDVLEPDHYDNVNFLLGGNCAYHPPALELREAADVWRGNNPEYFEYERKYPCSEETSMSSHSQYYLILQSLSLIVIAFQNLINY